MKYYSVLDVTPTSDAWIPAYVPTVNLLIAKHGGKYLARTSSHEQLEGDKKDAAVRVILEWPSKEDARNFMQDPEYAPHLKARTEGAVCYHYLIEGKDDLA